MTGEAVTPAYGYCPTCGAPGVQRERSINGNTTCANGHVYPSVDALSEFSDLSKSASSYGYELVMDIHRCDTDKFTEDGVRQFCEQVCDLIDMNREDFHVWASDPDDYDTDPPHLHGVSAVQFITTSSLVIHTLPKMYRAYVNLFSCKVFDAKEASEFTAEYFGGMIVKYHFLVRE